MPITYSNPSSNKQKPGTVRIITPPSSKDFYSGKGKGTISEFKNDNSINAINRVNLPSSGSTSMLSISTPLRASTTVVSSNLPPRVERNTQASPMRGGSSPFFPTGGAHDNIVLNEPKRIISTAGMATPEQSKALNRGKVSQFFNQIKTSTTDAFLFRGDATEDILGTKGSTSRDIAATAGRTAGTVAGIYTAATGGKNIAKDAGFHIKNFGRATADILTTKGGQFVAVNAAALASIKTNKLYFNTIKNLVLPKDQRSLAKNPDFKAIISTGRQAEITAAKNPFQSIAVNLPFTSQTKDAFTVSVRTDLKNLGYSGDALKRAEATAQASRSAQEFTFAANIITAEIGGNLAGGGFVRDAAKATTIARTVKGAAPLIGKAGKAVVSNKYLARFLGKEAGLKAGLFGGITEGVVSVVGEASARDQTVKTKDVVIGGGVGATFGSLFSGGVIYNKVTKTRVPSGLVNVVGNIIDFPAELAGDISTSLASKITRKTGVKVGGEGYNIFRGGTPVPNVDILSLVSGKKKGKGSKSVAQDPTIILTTQKTSSKFNAIGKAPNINPNINIDAILQPVKGKDPIIKPSRGGGKNPAPISDFILNINDDPPPPPPPPGKDPVPGKDPTTIINQLPNQLPPNEPINVLNEAITFTPQPRNPILPLPLPLSLGVGAGGSGSKKGKTKGFFNELQASQKLLFKSGGGFRIDPITVFKSTKRKPKKKKKKSRKTKMSNRLRIPVYKPRHPLKFILGGLP